MHRIIFAALTASLLLFSASATAVYKCEAAGGVTYGSTPCTNGKSTDLGAVPIPDSAASAKDRAKREKKDVARLEAHRHKAETEEEKAEKQNEKAADTKEKKCRLLELRKKWREEDAQNASGKNKQKAQRNARRAAESYELECGNR